MEHEDREMVEDTATVREFSASCTEVVSTSMIAQFGGANVLSELAPDALLILRCPGFDFDNIPGMGPEGARASYSEWRWGILKDDDGIWASLELDWPGGQERRLKINLDRKVRTVFLDLVRWANQETGLVEFAVSNETKGIPANGLLGIQIDVMDPTFREIASYVWDQEGRPDE